MLKLRKSSGGLWLASLASLLLFSGLNTQAQSTVTNGVVAYWNFDGMNFNDSANDFDGTQNGASPIAFVAGKPGFGQAIQLDGTDQFVEITGGAEDDLAFAGGSMSVGGWFKVGTFDKSWQALIVKGEGSNWRVHRRGGESGFAHAGGTGEGPAGTAVDDGLWHHFVAISDLDATDFGTALYVDGTQYTVNANPPNLAANGKRVMIGENPDARNRYWNGEVDDLAIWNRVVTPAEIAALYANGAGKPLNAFFTPPVDTDNDGMPDSWETQYGLNPNDPSDAAKDCNNNGVSNLDEYKAGLDPCDTTKPTVLSATTTGTVDTVKLTFSEDLGPTTATNAANYTISPTLAVTAATYKSKVVTLTTARQTPGATAYTVAVTGVKDPSKNEVAAGTTATFYSYVLTKTSVLKLSYWGGIAGATVDLLTSDPRYPASPDLVAAVFSFNSRDAFPDDSHENYGATIDGFLTPTESGNYNFFLRSDDTSQLWISTDDKEANLVMVAEELDCCDPFMEIDSGDQATTATPIALVAGTNYFVRVIYKEGGGGDYGQVAWRKTTDTTPAASLQPIPGKFLSSAVDVPAPAEGVFLTQIPAPNARNVSPATRVTIAHIDGKTVWTAANVTLKFDGAAVTPTFTKDGNVATIVYTPSTLLASKSTHPVTLGYVDAGGQPATSEWSFETLAYTGPTKDKVAAYPGLIEGSAVYTADRGGHTGNAGDYAMDMTRRGGPVEVLDTSWAKAAFVKDELTVSFWMKRYDIADSTVFRFSSASLGRAYHGHVPWSDSSIYFDTAGCCTADTQRISANIDTFADYTGDIGFWTNLWHNFAFTKKAGNKQIWIDGKLFLSGEGANPLPSDLGSLYIGSDGPGGSAAAHALMDDFAVFSTQLAEADLMSLAAGTLPSALPASKGLIAYWDFNDASAPSAPIVTATRSGNTITIQWSLAGGTLETTPALGPTATWTTVGTANPATITIGTSNGFYRVRK